MATLSADRPRSEERPPANRQAPARWAGDDAVPRGLAVASAITLRVAIVVGGLVVIGMGAARLMLLVLPLIVAVLLTTLLRPVACWLEERGLRPAGAAFLAVALAAFVFLGLWALIIPSVAGQFDELVDSVRQGAVQAAGVLEPFGVSRGDLDRQIHEGLSGLQGSDIANRLVSGALIITQWAAAVVLVAVLTFFFVKDGEQIWDWLMGLFADHRREPLDEVGSRAWGALAGYVQGVFLVATIDAVLIGIGLLVMGIPLALPLIVLTFLAAFFPIVGAFVAGAVAVLVALVTQGAVSAIVILAVIVAVQQLEGNVFYPVVVGRKLRLHPVAILLALTAGGTLGGVAGAFLAVPVAAVVAAVLEYQRERRELDERKAIAAPP
jgi:predicted PurR-regulated permease PerM